MGSARNTCSAHRSTQNRLMGPTRWLQAPHIRARRPRNTANAALGWWWADPVAGLTIAGAAAAMNHLAGYRFQAEVYNHRYIGVS